MPTGIGWIGSPNRTKGRQGFRPEAIVISNRGLGAEGALSGNHKSVGTLAPAAEGLVGRTESLRDRFRGPRDTMIRKAVYTERLTLLGTNPNLYTIGIEHEGDADSLWPDAMYAASAGLPAPTPLTRSSSWPGS